MAMKPWLFGGCQLGPIFEDTEPFARLAFHPSVAPLSGRKAPRLDTPQLGRTLGNTELFQASPQLGPTLGGLNLFSLHIGSSLPPDHLGRTGLPKARREVIEPAESWSAERVR